MSALLTVASIKEYIKTVLGSPLVTVEITDDQYTVLINKALNWYASFKPVFKYGSTTITAGIQSYVLSPVGRGVMEVYREDPLRMSVELNEFDIFRYNQFQAMRTQPGDYYMTRLWRDEVKRAVGADDDWEFDPVTSTIYISQAPTQSYNLVYLYAATPTLTEVPEYDDDYVEEYALALAKIALGRARNKYRGIPGAEGTIEMDGADLLAEGNDAIKMLEEQIQQSVYPVPPMRG